jgi:hypothetical protein
LILGGRLSERLGEASGVKMVRGKSWLGEWLREKVFMRGCVRGGVCGQVSLRLDTEFGWVRDWVGGLVR